MLSALQHPSWPNKSNLHSSLWFASRKWSILLLSDAIVQDVGSSATYGNKSVSSDEGAYIIPSAMIRTDGYILAWEYLASKVGPVRIQVRSTKKSDCRDKSNNYLGWDSSKMVYSGFRRKQQKATDAVRDCIFFACWVVVPRFSNQYRKEFREYVIH